MRVNIPSRDDHFVDPQAVDRHISRSARAPEFERFLRHALAAEGDESSSLRDWLELAEGWRIAQALRENGGNRSAAARSLGIGRRTLYAKMERLGIGPVWSVVGRGRPA